MCYNCTKHKSTGYSPFFLLFGRHPRLPVDLIFGTEDETNHVNHSQYAEKWRKTMTEAYKLAGKKSSEAGTRAKQRYDLPGDRVLVRNLRERGGPEKLHSHWEDQIHIVISRKGEDSPVYEVKPEAGTGGTEPYVRTCYCHPIIFPLTSQTKLARREKDDSGRMSVALPVRYLYHRPKTWQMVPVVMMSIQSSQGTPTLGGP